MQRSLTLLSLSLSLLAGVAGAQVPAAPAAPAAVPAAAVPVGQELPVDRVVGVVGDHAIAWSDVLEAVNQRRASGMQIPTDSAGQMEVAKKVLQELIDEELLIQRAVLEKIEVPDADLAKTVDAQVKRVRDQFRSEIEFRDELSKAGFGSPEEYRRRLTEQARRQTQQRKVIDKLRADGKLVSVAVSDADVSEAFERNRGTLPKRPATVTFRQIVIAPKPSAPNRLKALAKAESLLAELRRGGDFEMIAKRESMDPGSREVGGDLGWRRRGEMVPQFEAVMFGMAPGNMSNVVETSYGFHIIRVDRVQPGEVKSRHILIRPTIDSADVERTRTQADSIATAWRAGAKFDTLATLFHDPAEERGSLEPFPRDSLPASYQTAFQGKSANDVTDPFRVEAPNGGPPKFIIAQVVAVSEGGEYTVADLREQIRAQLSEERAIRRMLDQLRKATYVSLRL